MRSKTAAIALALAFSTTLTSAAVFMPQQAHAQNQRGYDMFYDDLAQDGRWVDHPRYGWVWYPTRVRSDWRPYSDGQWRWTDRHGWYWDSNERFGWATYHYGRWGYDDRYGHIWVPGDEWAPAWVSFRDSDDAIGWAPLPPETLGMTLLALLAGGRSSSYYRYVDMSDSYYQPRWTFVPTRYFTNDRVYTHAYSWRDNDRYYRGSNNVTNYIQVNNYYVNRSIDPRRWESRTGRQLVTVNVREANSRDQWRDRDRRDERNISVFKPRIERDRDGRSAPPPAARATVNDKPVVQVQREWTAPEERRDRPNTRDEWRQRYSQGNDRNDNDRDRDRNAQGQNDRDRNDRDRDGNDRDRTDRDGRPGGATPATPATRATPADPGVNPATRATPATPATPPDRNARQPDRDRNDGDRDRAEQQREQQQRAQQERAQKQREQQEKIQQQRTEQQRQQQERAQQQRAEQERAQQQRAQQQRDQQEKIQQQRQQQQEKVQQQQRQQQEKVQQQRQQQQEKVQQQQRQQPDRAQRARQPEQAAKPERQPEQRQQPQRGKQEQRGNGNECPPNQPNCR